MKRPGPRRGGFADRAARDERALLEDQYQLLACSWAQAPAGEPYLLWM